MNKTSTVKSSRDLRQDAEAALRQTARHQTTARSPEHLLHELQVHQIELEIQNAALRQSQFDLEESRDRYLDLYELAPVGYLSCSRDGQIETINLTGATLLGEARSRLLLSRFTNFVVTEEQDRWHRCLVDTFEHTEPQRCEISLRRRDGTSFFAALDLLPRRWADGRATLRITITDITPRRQAELALLRANQQLEALVAEQVAYLSELAGDLTLSEQRERDRLHGLLHDEIQPLLVATRLSLSGLSTQTAPADCRRVAADSCANIGLVILLARSLGQQLCPPLIRERGLLQALESLCLSVKTDYGLCVELHAAPDAEPEDLAIRLACFNAVRELLMNVVKHAGETRVSIDVNLFDQAMVVVTVTDHGCGFDPAIASGGTGLAGLARRLAMFGGSVQIDSRPGGGTVASFRVPLRSAHTAGWAHGSIERRAARG